MTDIPETTRDELLQIIEESWDEFNSALERLSDDVITSVKDRQGWTVKDILAHISAWERSVVFLLQGQERFQGLGVSENTFLSGNIDEINDEIYQQNIDYPLEYIRTEFQAVHVDLLDKIRQLQDSDLHKPTRSYIPEDSNDDSSSVLIQVFFANTSEHYDEHREWIESLIST